MAPWIVFFFTIFLSLFFSHTTWDCYDFYAEIDLLSFPNLPVHLRAVRGWNRIVGFDLPDVHKRTCGFHGEIELLCYFLPHPYIGEACGRLGCI